MMYGVWNKKNGRDKQILRYYETWDKAEARAKDYLNSKFNDPYREAYWGDVNDYEIVEFSNVYTLDYIFRMPEAYVVVLTEEMNKILKKCNGDITKVKEFPFPDDLKDCFVYKEDAFDECDSDQSIVHFVDGKPAEYDETPHIYY